MINFSTLLIRHPPRFSLLCITLVLLVKSTPTMALINTNLSEQRQKYRDAIYSLKQGRLEDYSKLEIQLRDYPLHPYLKYSEIIQRLSRTPNQEVINFINQYSGTPLATRLHRSWQRELVRKQQWDTLVENYLDTNNVKMKCHFAHALKMINRPMAAYDVIEQIWLTGKSLPKVCDSVVSAGLKSGKITQDLVLERIRLALQKNKTKLARYLMRYLDKQDHHWINLWLEVRRDPQLINTDDRLHYNIRIVRWILVDGTIRLARRDAITAAELWAQFQKYYSFTNPELNRVSRHLTLHLSRGRDDNSIKWLAALNLVTGDDYMSGIHIISSIKDRDWQSAINWLDQLSEKQRHSDRWRYWRARVLEAMGRLDEARDIYHLNASERSYYGFLAADRNGLAYQFTDKPLIFSSGELAVLQQNPAISRARELYLLNEIVDARREWHYAINRMNYSDRLMAAQTAADWGWHDRAIVTFGLAKYWDDLKRRFPLVYQNLVVTQATRQKINPAWAYAIIRQESAFTPDARSHAGALGLMQLLPRTARSVARSLRLRYHNRFDLLNVNTNVKLGVRYLKDVSDRFNGNNVLATAAYNAGGYRVSQWLPESTSLPADLWVETVPFNETRDYLKRVMTYTIIYEQRLGQTPKTLSDSMPIIMPATGIGTKGM